MKAAEITKKSTTSTTSTTAAKTAPARAVRPEEKTQAPATVAPAMEKSTAKAKAPTREQIAARAYEIYVGRGRAAGHEVADWMQAERELNGK